MPQQPKKTKSPPKTQACTICGYPRPFLRMREKEGSDGRVARWPEYKQCKFKNDPNKHPTRRNQSEVLDAELREEVRNGALAVIQHRKLPVGVLYQTEFLEEPLEGLAPCLLHFEEKHGSLPMAVAVNPNEAGDVTELDWELANGKTTTLPLWPNKGVSPGRGYIFLVTGEE